jgi:hypothetical protein
MAHPLRTIACAGLAAGAVYYFDPSMGRRRRALLRDQWLSFTARSMRAADAAYRDSSNRLQGVLAETRTAFAGRYHDEESLTARIRSQLGRLVSHPAAVEVNVGEDAVVLSGHVLASEVDRLIEAVRSMPEVPQVESRLEIQEDNDQSGVLRDSTDRDESSTTAPDWSHLVRAATTIAAAGLAAKTLMALGSRRWLPMAIGGVLATQTVKLWQQECAEVAERKSHRARERGSSSKSEFGRQSDQSDARQSESKSSGRGGQQSSSAAGPQQSRPATGPERSGSTPGGAPTAGVSPGAPQQSVIHDV